MNCTICNKEITAANQAMHLIGDKLVEGVSSVVIHGMSATLCGECGFEWTRIISYLFNYFKNEEGFNYDKDILGQYNRKVV